MDSLLNFILPVLIGFYIIYKSIKSLDLIYQTKTNGLRTRAKVVKIREVSNYDDNDYGSGYQLNNKYNYYFTVRFNDKRGKQIEQELKFPVTKKPNRNPIFEVDILYTLENNMVKEVILVNNRGRNNTFYFILMIGIFFLLIPVINYNGEIDVILNYIKSIFE